MATPADTNCARCGVTERLVDTIVIYQDNQGDWRWKAKAGNNEVVADSGEGYQHLSHALDTAHRMFPRADTTVVIEPPQPGP